MFQRTLAPAFVLLNLCSLPATAQQTSVTLSVIDTDSARPIPARVYFQSLEGGKPYFFTPVAEGSAFKYEKQNWINKNSVQSITPPSRRTRSHRNRTTPGKYKLIDPSDGKEYLPRQVEEIESEGVRSGSTRHPDFTSKRWINMASTRLVLRRHAHPSQHRRTEKRHVLAEDLNVVFPLTNWVTIAETAACRW